MLDIGFSEILVIFVLALVVLGPEKLPRFTSQVGRWIGRARGMARQFREQLEEEVNLEEARKAEPQVTRNALPPVSASTALPSTYSPPSPQPEPEQRTVYPDNYSHAHPTTDSMGGPLDSVGRPPDPLSRPEVPSSEPPAADPAQHDWVGGVTTTHEKGAQAPADAGYAPPHERGT